MRMLWSMVCSTIMFGIVGSVVANVFQLPDILESVRSIGVGDERFVSNRNGKERHFLSESR